MFPKYTLLITPMSKSTVRDNIFAFPVDRKSAQVILTGVPWDATTSYGGGTSLGPEAILKASPQIDLFDLELGDAYLAGYYMDPINKKLLSNNRLIRAQAKKIINFWDSHSNNTTDPEALRKSKKLSPILNKVNAACDKMVSGVYKKTAAVLSAGQIPGLIGGDHSTPLGAIQAVSEKYRGDFAVLHLDAHADLRKAYQGFKHSHASIMRNVSELPQAPKKLVQVGIRDFCTEEYEFIESQKGKIHTYFDQQLKSELFQGKTWQSLCEEIISHLPKNVYLSFDIDGLSPEFCPNTGTPVPGGLSFDQALHLLRVLGKSDRIIVGFDLNEVSPGKDTEWDGNVGARLLFKMCGWAVKTQSRKSK